MRLSFLAACLLIAGMRAAAAGVPPLAAVQPAPAQTTPQQQPDRPAASPTDIHRLLRSPSSPATGSPVPQPGSQENGGRQLPPPVGLLLAIALLNGGGAGPPETARPKDSLPQPP